MGSAKEGFRKLAQQLVDMNARLARVPPADEVTMENWGPNILSFLVDIYGEPKCDAQARAGARLSRMYLAEDCRGLMADLRKFDADQREMLRLSVGIEYMDRMKKMLEALDKEADRLAEALGVQL
jgi:hypothetical protein